MTLNTTPEGGRGASVRLANPEDAGPIRIIYESVVAQTAISFETHPPGVEEMRQRIEKILEKYPWLVCERGGEVLGYAYASQHRGRSAYQWSVDVSVYVHPDARRGGVGRALYRSLFEVLRRQGFYHALAGIALPNPGSVGLHESLGFQPVGVYRAVGYKLGAWHDVGWWHLVLQPPPPLPAPPVGLPDLIGKPVWDEALAAGRPSL